MAGYWPGSWLRDLRMKMKPTLLYLWLKSKGIAVSRMFIHYYTEHFTNENPFHKIVYILLAVSQPWHIAVPVTTFIMRHFIALCTMCAWRTAFPIPVIIAMFVTHIDQVFPWHVQVLNANDDSYSVLPPIHQFGHRKSLAQVGHRTLKHPTHWTPGSLVFSWNQAGILWQDIWD